jgi:hypothetical protein
MKTHPLEESGWRIFGPCRCAALSSNRALRSHSPRRVAALSSHRVRRLYVPLWVGVFFLVCVGAPRSLRIAFGGRIVRVGSPRSLRIALEGSIVRVGAPRPSQHAACARNMCFCTLTRAAGNRFARDGKEPGPRWGNNYPENGLVKPPRRDTRALSSAGMFGGKAPLRLAAQKSRLHAPSVPMRSAPAY